MIYRIMRDRRVIHVISTINGGSNIVNNRISLSEMNYGTMYNVYVLSDIGCPSSELSTHSLHVIRYPIHNNTKY